jgi:CRP-like cAMP-binding protein
MTTLDASAAPPSARKAARHPLTLLPNVLKVLGPEAQAKLRKHSYVESVPKGQLVMQTGEIFHDVIVVQSGWLAADIDDVCVNLLPANTFFFLYLGDVVRPAICNLRAVSSSTSIAVIDKDAFWDALSEAPQIMRSLCDSLVLQMSRAQVDTAKRITEPLELRLANFLWGIGVPVGNGRRRIPSVIPQPYIASYLGASREEVSRKKQLLIRANYLYKVDNDWYMDRVPVAMD